MVALAAWLPLAATTAPKLQPHLGVYELSMIEARDDVGIETVRGRLVIEITDSCDGYAQTQRMLLRIVNTQGDEITSDSNHTTWESRDGTTIRFNSKNEINGEVSEIFAGRAQLEGRGLAGAITFAKPDDLDVPLLAGTIFPTEHFFDLIEAGLRVKRLSIVGSTMGRDRAASTKRSRVSGFPSTKSAFASLRTASRRSYSSTTATSR